jgi:hypothetical protein
MRPQRTVPVPGGAGPVRVAVLPARQHLRQRPVQGAAASSASTSAAAPVQSGVWTGAEVQCRGPVRVHEQPTMWVDLLHGQADVPGRPVRGAHASAPSASSASSASSSALRPSVWTGAEVQRRGPMRVHEQPTMWVDLLHGQADVPGRPVRGAHAASSAPSSALRPSVWTGAKVQRRGPVRVHEQPTMWVDLLHGQADVRGRSVRGAHAPAHASPAHASPHAASAPVPGEPDAVRDGVLQPQPALRGRSLRPDDASSPPAHARSSRRRLRRHQLRPERILRGRPV